MDVPEVALPGGVVTPVVRVGGTVRRRQPVRAEFVHRLLAHLAEHEWPGAPRFLGTDEHGREVLTFLPGHVAWHRAAVPHSVECLRALARLLRQFHDLTAGTPLAGDAEVVCHNDLSPKNTVYRDLGSGLRPVAFIDWDIAAPGSRIHDLAHACWQYLDLGPSWSDATAAGRLLAVIGDAYRGDTDFDDAGLVETVLWWQDRCWRGIEAEAEAGEPAMVRLREAGVPADIIDAYRWVRRHRRALSDAVAG